MNLTSERYCVPLANKFPSGLTSLAIAALQTNQSPVKPRLPIYARPVVNLALRFIVTSSPWSSLESGSAKQVKLQKQHNSSLNLTELHYNGTWIDWCQVAFDGTSIGKAPLEGYAYHCHLKINIFLLHYCLIPRLVCHDSNLQAQKSICPATHHHKHLGPFWSWCRGDVWHWKPVGAKQLSLSWRAKTPFLLLATTGSILNWTDLQGKTLKLKRKTKQWQVKHIVRLLPRVQNPAFSALSGERWLPRLTFGAMKWIATMVQASIDLMKLLLATGLLPWVLRKRPGFVKSFHWICWDWKQIIIYARNGV